MPAKSKAQQMAAGAALAAKRGEISPSELIGPSRQMYASMSEAQLDEFASTRRGGKPRYAKAARKKAARTSAKSARKTKAAAKNAKKRVAPKKSKRK